MNDISELILSEYKGFIVKDTYQPVIVTSGTNLNYEGLLHKPDDALGVAREKIKQQINHMNKGYNGFYIMGVHEDHVGIRLHPQSEEEKTGIVYGLAFKWITKPS